MSADLGALVSRLEAVTTKLEKVAAGKGSVEESHEIVEAYDGFLSGSVAKFVDISRELGGDVSDQVKLLLKAFQAQRSFLDLVSKHKTPNPETLSKLLQPTSTAINDVQQYRESHRGSKMFNHLSAVSEGIPCLGWVTVVKGAIFIKDTFDSSVFYTNRVIKDFKESNPKHVEWARSLKSIFDDLTSYVKEYHASGLSWNPNGPAAPSAPLAPAGGAPPPPPPPAVVPPTDTPKAPQVNAAAANALFGEINKAGTNISAGLKKVTDDQKTHKNPALRQTCPVPDKPKPAAKPAPSKAKPAVAAKKPPVFQLQGKKWIVDYQEENRSLVIDGEMQQTVYMYMCKNSTLQVKGKVNSITLDGCKKCAVVFDNVVATCEFINCQSVQCQVNGAVPTISIDKTDGCQIYLSKESLNCDIISAKSSEMNVLIPKDDGDFAEYALPEQYKSKWDGKTFVTKTSESF